MKIFIIGVVSAFIISAGITIWLTGTFSKGAAENQNDNKQEQNSLKQETDLTKTEYPETEKLETIAPVDNNQSDINTIDMKQGNKYAIPENPSSESNEVTISPKEIDKLKSELEQYKTQIEAEKAKLAAIKSEIESLNNQKSSVTKSQQLAKLYGSMKPEKAASVLCTLEENLSVQILTQMNNSTSAKIMDAIAKLNPEYAAKISKSMLN